MKLDGEVLRYLSADEFRVLTAVEMGMRNHELLPTAMIGRIAGLKSGQAIKLVKELHKNKLVYHENKRYDGYKLTYLGYDYLALKAYVNRGLISGLGRRIGVGKEADIYECCNENGDRLVLKIQRLGRISFRQIKNKRDYLLHRQSASWLYMSRLAAIREWAFLKALFDHDFPVPTPIDQNRHTILMSFVCATPFVQVRSLSQPMSTYSILMNLIIRLAEHGLIHCDFNEFNLLMDADEKITLIDFPQMVSTNHRNAKMYFDRDVQCIRTYFRKRFGYETEEFPSFFVDAHRKMCLDEQLKASGADATPEELENFQKIMDEKLENPLEENDEEEEEEEEDEDEAQLIERLGIKDEEIKSAANDEAAEEDSAESESESAASSDSESSKRTARLARKDERTKANRARNDRKAARGREQKEKQNTNKISQNEEAKQKQTETEVKEGEVQEENQSEEHENENQNESSQSQSQSSSAVSHQLLTDIRAKVKSGKLKFSNIPSNSQIAKMSRNTVKSKAKAKIRAEIAQDSSAF